jgi:transposase
MKRLNFVKEVAENGLSITKSAQKFNIKLSTAKLIFKKYKETGEFSPKRSK